MTKSIIKAIDVFDFILNSCVNYPKDAVLSARNSLIDELEAEAKSLRQHAASILEQANNCYVSGAKQTKVNRLFKSAKELNIQAEALEIFLLQFH
jgi:hypothetical protein